MKREELEKIGLTKEQIDSVMTINGTEVEANKKTVASKDEQITSLTTERDGLKAQVADRDKDITELKKDAGTSDDLKTKLSDLQTKYDTDTKSFQTKLDQQRLDFAAEQMFAGAPFASTLARKAAIADFKSKGYKLAEDGKTFIGADGYIDGLKKEDPAAFVPDKKEEDTPPEDVTPPKFTTPGGQNTPPPSGGSGFFSRGGLNYVRTPPAEPGK